MIKREKAKGGSFQKAKELSSGNGVIVPKANNWLPEFIG